MDQETIRELKRIELELGRLRKTDRLLRERISVSSGDYAVDFFRQGSLSGTLTAGNGLSGGGTFPGSVSIAIDLASPSGLEFSSGQLQVIDTIAGGGLTISSKVLAVGAGNGITINADDIALTMPGSVTVSSSNNPAGNHTHAVTSSSNPGASAQILASNASGYLQVERIGAGRAPSLSPVEADGYIYSEGDGSSAGYLSYRYSNDATSPYWSARKARGSLASPAIVQNGDVLWQMNISGYDGSAWEPGGNIYFLVDGSPGANDMPTSMRVDLSASGSGAPTYALSLSNAANLSVRGELHTFGILDTVGAQIRVFGKQTGYTTGGQLVLDTAADHDATISYYVIESDEDDLRIWPSSVAWINKFVAEGQLQLSATGSGAGILIGGDAQWYRSAANMMSTPDDVTIETRCFGFLKAQNQDGRIGNGPVEYGEVVSVCGIMEIAPGGALYEAVTIS